MVRKHAFHALVVSLALCCVESSSGDVFVPPGLNPGDTYHLAFVTDGGRNATSNSIADYNAFVQAEAERSGAFTETFGIDWFAIASTSATHARENALVSAPVFLLDGANVADSFSDIWDGSIDTPLSINQFLTSPNFPPVWTGSFPSGFASTLPLGAPSVFPGYALTSDFSWLNIGTTSRPTSNAYLFYALSEELTVPEPAAFFLCTAASVLAWLFDRPRRCRRMVELTLVGGILPAMRSGPLHPAATFTPIALSGMTFSRPPSPRASTMVVRWLAEERRITATRRFAGLRLTGWWD